MKLNFDSGVKVFRAVKHRTRAKILQYLEEVEEATVTDLYVKCRIEQSECSRHLNILRDANIVNYRREGKNIYYSLNYETIKKLTDFVSQMEGGLALSSKG